MLFKFSYMVVFFKILFYEGIVVSLQLLVLSLDSSKLFSEMLDIWFNMLNLLYHVLHFLVSNLIFRIFVLVHPFSGKQLLLKDINIRSHLSGGLVVQVFSFS